MMMTLPFAVAVLILMPTLGPSPRLQDTLTADVARHVFDEAAEISSSDAGRLWGVALYGPMIIADPQSRKAIANRTIGTFEKEGDLFVGSLPETIAVANTAFDWEDTRWTMLMWPLPEDADARRRLIAHEMWHRIQTDLHLPSSGAGNLHLGTRDGRVWLQLEWRALSAALRNEGEARQNAAADALAFRKKRHKAFPGAAAEERSLMMHEGLAEYTAVVLGSESVEESLNVARTMLEAAPAASTFVRSFAYTSGPAYGLLLDDFSNGWRARVSPEKDLPDLLAHALSGATTKNGGGRHLVQAVDRYNGRALMAAEDRLESQRQEKLADMRRRFLDGPTLTLDFVRMNVEFDPGTVEALDMHGSVYPAMRLTDEWGALRVTDGALITSDWRSAVVPAPTTDPSHDTLSGEGYELRLADGWELAPGRRKGDYRVVNKPGAANEDPVEVTFLTSDGVTIFGDYYAGSDPTAPVILLFHQGASNARAEYGPLAPRLQEAGYRLLAIDARRGGSRFGGENRTLAALNDGQEYTYCDCYLDLVAALDYASNELGAEKVIAWGSSYSAALVFRLAVDHADRIKAVLAFSPASGDPMEGCKPEPFAARTKAPVLILRPAREMELEHVAAQAVMFEAMGLPVYVADPAVHASSMLNPNRVDGDVEPAWERVLGFLRGIE